MKQFSNVVYTALTLAVCLLAVVNALPVLAESAVEEPHTILAAGDEEQSSANEEDINAALPDIDYFGGDIILTPDQRLAMEASFNTQHNSTDVRRAVNRISSTLWPNGRVPYVIDRSLGTRARASIGRAIQKYEQNSCVRFVPRASETDYVEFFRGTGCYSYVGRVGGAQKLSVGVGCELTGVVMHEMFHALGRWHEHSRPDRNLYIRISYNNIRSGTAHNFVKLSNAAVSTQGVTYDTGSIMHYNAYAFSRNGKPTIVPQRGVSTNQMGQRLRFTSQDVQHINALYCDQNVDVGRASWSSWTSWSACSRTCNGGTRFRRRTCVGGVSCVGTNVQEQQCNTQSCRVPAKWGTWSTWSGCSVSCGGGRQSRTRRCTNGNTCVGQSTEFRDCNTQNCPVAATWGTWSTWSGCSVSCGGGRQSRTRRCINGNTCVGQNTEFRDCNTQNCSPGYRHLGCYELTRRYALRTLGRFDVNAVKNCAAKSQDLGFTVFAVVLGYCISASNNVEDYNTRRSSLCVSGEGRYVNEKLYLDVYTSAALSGNIANDAYGSLGFSPLPWPLPSPSPTLNPQQTAESGSMLLTPAFHTVVLTSAVLLLAF